MEIVNNIELYDKKVNTSIALGTFDGVHLAHTAVINEALNSEFTPAVFTFSQSPSGVINGGKV
ncbi:MAG: bifunctional riboflavin kinase/FMN adenylyltransferase, partial [Clostridia bacterium]|nr:bifunctional riboflavin kinase/FMN adenylyltransferase [Clostridia bacterium]